MKGAWRDGTTHLIFDYPHCIGAQAAGMKGCFVNRRRRPYEETPYQPTLVVDDFTELADALA